MRASAQRSTKASANNGCAAPHHVGLIAWLERAADGAAPEQLENAVGQIAAATGADGSLIEPLGVLATMAWISRAGPFDDAALEIARLDPTGTYGARIALGEPGAGMAGFRRSHVEATHARRAASLTQTNRGTVTRYQRVELLAIATVDPDRTQMFVRRTLGDLAHGDDVSRRLAATLDVYLQENCSRSRAAKRLGIHGNTISYRIRQAEEILGVEIDANVTRLSVALALLPAVRTTPDA